MLAILVRTIMNARRSTLTGAAQREILRSDRTYALGPTGRAELQGGGSIRVCVMKTERALITVQEVQLCGRRHGCCGQRDSNRHGCVRLETLMRMTWQNAGVEDIVGVLRSFLKNTSMVLARRMEFECSSLSTWGC